MKIQLAAVLVLGACSTSQSKDIATAGMSITATVTATSAASAHVTTVLNVGQGLSTDYVELSAGDTLVASDGLSSQTMSAGGGLEPWNYSGTLSVGTGTVTINYQRAAPQIAAPSTKVTLPSDFSITSQTSGTDSYSRASSPITFTWSDAGQSDPMTYEVSGNCVSTYSGTIPSDTGTFTVPPGTLQVNPGSSSLSCPITIQVTRSRHGTVDPAFGGGSIIGYQMRQAAASSTP